jgi:WhiB family redox-sensing transcriptional regulator
VPVPFATSWPDGASLSPGPCDRARIVLLDDPTFTDAEVALRARCTRGQAARVRKQLTGYGILPASNWPRPAFPHFRGIGHQPRALRLGSCVGHGRPELWTGPATPADCELARRICGGCPVLDTCREWSLGLPQDDLALWGGWTASDRNRERLRRRGQPIPAHMTSAGKNAARQRRRHPPPPAAEETA